MHPKLSEEELVSLYSAYGKNKILPSGFQQQALQALSYYPELKEISVRFVIKKATLPLASRPYWPSMFFKKKNWKYLIVISSHSNKYRPELLLKNIPFEAQVGILGHELAHTSYYLDKNIWDILKMAINFLKPSFRQQFERSTDITAIKHGLGSQLYSFHQYFNQFNDKKTQSLRKYYLSPEEVKGYIK